MNFEPNSSLSFLWEYYVVCGVLPNNQKVSPHTLRHTTAMHLLQSGVDISVIALWLGHESIETTHMYLEADLQTKQKALEKLAPIDSVMPKFKPTDEVLAFLASL